MTEDFRNSWVKAIESIRREQEMKKQLTEQLTGLFEGIKNYKNSTVKATIPAERIAYLEETMPEFAEETQEGFSKAEIKKIIIEMMDQLIKELNLKQLEGSVLVMLYGIKVQKVDFSKCNGEALYEYLTEKDGLKELCSPNFKKRAIVSSAAELTVEKGNISFNQAMHRIVDECRNGTYIDEALEKGKEDAARLCGIFTPIIEWYMKNEVEIIRWISKD